MDQHGPKIECEQVNCPLCGGGDHVPFLAATPISAAGQTMAFGVVECRACKLRFTNPRPTAAAIGAFYDAAYEPYRPADAQAKRGRLRPSALERRLLRNPGHGRLLDFGCGGGVFLERMRAIGWDVLGLDMAADVVRRLRDERGLRVLAGTLPHPELTKPEFDVVTMWHSLEHLHDPLSALRAARDVLVPGGRLIVAVPNIDCGAFGLCRGAWFGVDLPRHLVHFTTDTLTGMVRRAGVEVSSVVQARHTDWLRRSIDALSAQPRKPWWLSLVRSHLASSALSRWWQWSGRAETIVAIGLKSH